jgi:hypothetical protein
LLSNSARATFYSITDLPNSVMNDLLNEQVPGFDPASVQINNKPGGKSYSGDPGDFAHRPQLGDHKVTADACMMQFSNGQVVFFAVIVDDADVDCTYRSISCTGWPFISIATTTTYGSSYAATCQQIRTSADHPSRSRFARNPARLTSSVLSI